MGAIVLAGPLPGIVTRGSWRLRCWTVTVVAILAGILLLDPPTIRMDLFKYQTHIDRLVDSGRAERTRRVVGPRGVVDVYRGGAFHELAFLAVGETPPSDTISESELMRFIEEIDGLLRKEHEEDYCGIVYVDDKNSPSFVKIFDPHNLGVSCGYSDNPPLPGWILSKLMPVDLQAPMPQPGNRRRWWKRLFAS